jgi:hypothetical protein
MINLAANDPLNPGFGARNLLVEASSFEFVQVGVSHRMASDFETGVA